MRTRIGWSTAILISAGLLAGCQVPHPIQIAPTEFEKGPRDWVYGEPSKEEPAKLAFGQVGNLRDVWGTDAGGWPETGPL